jgi:hypothetical protein
LVEVIASTTTPPVTAGGVLAPSLDGCYPHRTGRGTRPESPDRARTEELDNLRLALATFALQLDMFEMRMGARMHDGENDWPSIKSPGSKSAA